MRFVGAIYSLVEEVAAVVRLGDACDGSVAEVAGWVPCFLLPFTLVFAGDPCTIQYRKKPCNMLIDILVTKSDMLLINTLKS